MRWRQGLLIMAAALLAAGLGLVTSVAVYGPGPLLSSKLGQALLWYWPSAGGLVDGSGLAIGARVPRVETADLQGQRQQWPRPGRVQLINYWASWCAPCRKEMPLLAGYSRRGRAGDAEVISIAQDTPEAAAQFLARQPMPFMTLVEVPGEHDSSAAFAGDRRGILPFTVLIGADGRLLKRRYGAFEDASELAEWADAAR